MLRLIPALLAASLAFTGTYAQTFTACNPLNATCPSDQALGQYAQFDFTQNEANSAVWNSTSTPLGFGGNGAEFTIAKSGDSPTIHSNFYIFFGTLSIVMKAAPGTGIVSSIVLLSDDLDEIDWEFLGGNRTVVESNYFGKGNTTTYNRAVYHTLPFAPQDDFHNYTIDWNKDRLNWIIDGKIVRTLNYGDAVGGKNYPQTPMQVHLGSWAAGDPNEPKGVIEWAQGTTNYDNGPFNMYIKQVYVQDAASGAQYTYGDRSGSYPSIQVQAGTSPIVAQLNKKIGIAAHWNALSPTTRIIIIACSCAGFVGIIGAIVYCCVASTRKGLREHAQAEAEWESQQKESEHYRNLLRDQARADSFGSNSASRSMLHHDYK